MTRRPRTVAGDARGLRSGIVLGVGLGEFVDGILLYQLLQWHHMLSGTNHDRVGLKYYNPDTVSGLEMNTLWDGVFHAVCGSGSPIISKNSQLAAVGGWACPSDCFLANPLAVSVLDAGERLVRRWRGCRRGRRS
jgi:hypothetical protein